MTDPVILAIRMDAAHKRALEILRKHGTPERVEAMETNLAHNVNTRNPIALACYQAEMMASLAEMIEDLHATSAGTRTKKPAKKATTKEEA